MWPCTYWRAGSGVLRQLFQSPRLYRFRYSRERARQKFAKIFQILLMRPGAIRRSSAASQHSWQTAQLSVVRTALSRRGDQCCRTTLSPARSSVTSRHVRNFVKISAKKVARFRLYRHRFLQEHTRFAAFFKIYQIIKLKFLKFGEILQILRHLQNVAEFRRKYCWFFKPIFCENFEIAAVQKDANLATSAKFKFCWN